jgi:hypothetical protein
VLEDFVYHLGTADGREFVEVPAGFITDFASIPRGLWNVLPPTGKYGKAAVIHDFLYQYRVISVEQEPCIVPCTVPNCPTCQPLRLCNRGEADRIFKEAMGVLGCSWFTRNIVYAGVRAGGWAAWRKHRKDRKED